MITYAPKVASINEALKKIGDLETAKGMQAYMKTTQKFYGVQAGPRRKAFKVVARNFKNITREEYEQIIFELWNGRYREEMYQALEVAEHYKSYRDIKSWSIYERLVKSASNWDTLDWIVGKLVSPLILRHRELEQTLVKWSNSDNFWMRRASLLAHLRHRDETNTQLLAQTILKLSHEQEFFIRKAIGWILRDYSYSTPQWVLTFVAKHHNELSGLSRREALKQINRGTKK